MLRSNSSSMPPHFFAQPLPMALARSRLPRTREREVLPDWVYVWLYRSLYFGIPTAVALRYEFWKLRYGSVSERVLEKIAFRIKDSHQSRAVYIDALMNDYIEPNTHCAAPLCGAIRYCSLYAFAPPQCAPFRVGGTYMDCQRRRRPLICLMNLRRL